MSQAPLRAVLLDRDGTINAGAAEGDYVTSAGQVRLLPGAAAALARLGRAGLRLAVVTNQRGIALGRMTRSDVDAVNHRVAELLAASGVAIAGWYVCPHDREGCACRKPRDGLVRAALADLGVPPAEAAIVGDRCTDVQAGTGLGLFRVLVAARPGDAVQLPACAEADLVVADLAEAADVLVRRAPGADGRPAAGVHVSDRTRGETRTTNTLHQR